MNLNHLRRQIVQAAYNAGEGHIASALSILDILWVLYDRVLNVYPNDPGNDARDRFVLSKGHGSLALYAVLAEKGFFPMGELDRFASYNSFLGGHPDSRVPGVEAATGSLGHGLPIAIGMALGMRIRKANQRVFVLVGDGECNEGSVWEAALLATHHNLSNLTCIVDYNHSTDRALALGDVADKFLEFGWFPVEVNGHNHDDIYEGIDYATEDRCRPGVIVAETTKGKGCKRMENNPAWHHRVPTQEELAEILEELC